MPLNDGERQVTTDVSCIRPDHRTRYEWAVRQIGKDDEVIDVGCGIGYGSRMLAAVAKGVFAFDKDAETITYAQRHYAGGGNIVYGCGDVEDASFYSPATVAVAFEVIEHVQDPRTMLLSLRASGCKTLFASVPNESVYPFRTPERQVGWHYRHYTHDEFENLLNDCGWRVVEWWGQEGKESDVARDVEGRTLVVKAEPFSAEVQRLVPREVEATRKHIAIIGLGPSAEAYVDHVKRLGSRHAFCDEVWGINAIGSVLDCDAVFHMDDVRIQEIRAAARPQSNIAAMVRWLKVSRIPVITSRAHPAYPALVEFPFEDVVNALGRVYFNNTGAYAVAYAIFKGATKISLFGCDYTYPDAHKAEKGRACMEFWLGYAASRGIDIALPGNTSLLDSLVDDSSDDVYAYGYDAVKIRYDEAADGTMKFTMTPRATLPSADAIEGSYDHGKPPNEQHQRIAAQ